MVAKIAEHSIWKHTHTHVLSLSVVAIGNCAFIISVALCQTLCRVLYFHALSQLIFTKLYEAVTNYYFHFTDKEMKFTSEIICSKSYHDKVAGQGDPNPHQKDTEGVRRKEALSKRSLRLSRPYCPHGSKLDDLSSDPAPVLPYTT